MKLHVRLAPPNSLIFLFGGKKAVVPKIEGDHPVWSTPSGVAVQCLSFMDGETDVWLSDDPSDVRSEAPIFDAMLETMEKRVEVRTSENDLLLECRVLTRQTRTRIWTNAVQEPNDILIVVGNV